MTGSRLSAKLFFLIVNVKADPKLSHSFEIDTNDFIDAKAKHF